MAVSHWREKSTEQYWEDKIQSLEYELRAKLNDPDVVKAWAIREAQYSCDERYEKARRNGIAADFDYNACVKRESREQIRWWPVAQKMAKRNGLLRDVEEIKKELTEARQELERIRKAK